MRERDEALQTVREAVRSQGEKEAEIDSELSGYKASIKKEADKSVQLFEQLDKNKSDLERLNKLMEEINHEDKKISE